MKTKFLPSKQEIMCSSPDGRQLCEPKIMLTWILNHKNMANKLILCLLELSS